MLAFTLLVEKKSGIKEEIGIKRNKAAEMAV